MLANPKYGWTNVSIGEFNECASYLTDVPNDCLDAFIYARENGFPAVVYFDAEGYEYYLIASYFESFITIEKDELKTYRFDLGLVDLAKELIDDIEQNIDEWADWQCYKEYDENQLKINKRKLEQKIRRLKQLIAIN